jgi:Tetratricopeptide repeat
VRPAALRGLALAALAALVACAKPVAPRLPEGLDFVYSTPAPGELAAPDMSVLQTAWREVLAGDTKSAIKRYEKLLRRYPGSVATRTGLAYARLRAGEGGPAQAAFLAVLEKRPEHVPALVGMG